MAGDWLPIDHDLPDKLEVIGIMGMTGASVEIVCHRLFLLWRLADRQTVDGVLVGVTPCGLAERLGGTKDFWLAVETVGWLRFTKNGAIVPGFAERFGNSARNRILSCKRMQSLRRRRNSSVMVGVTAENPQPQPQPVSLPESESESESEPEPQTGVASATPCAADAARIASADAIRAVFAHYRTYHPRAFRKPAATSKEWRAIQARLREGFSVDDLRAAIDGNHRSPFHCGENDRGKEYHALELIVRDGSKVTQFVEIPLGGAVVSEKERRGQRAAQMWIERMDQCEAKITQSSQR